MSKRGSTNDANVVKGKKGKTTAAKGGSVGDQEIDTSARGKTV